MIWPPLACFPRVSRSAPKNGPIPGLDNADRMGHDGQCGNVVAFVFHDFRATMGLGMEIGNVTFCGPTANAFAGGLAIRQYE
jgi:hypothetical protein